MLVVQDVMKSICKETTNQRVFLDRLDANAQVCAFCLLLTLIFPFLLVFYTGYALCTALGSVHK